MKQQRFQDKKNREPAFAGQFYPASPQELTRQLNELFKSAGASVTNRKPLAIIAPHAGYVFSGRVAASAYNQIPGNADYKRVFVIASSHRFLFNGAAVFDSGNYITPLGEIPVDTDLAKALIKSGKYFMHEPEAHESEHSLEVQLPFLQHKLKNKFTLVPIILGTNNSSHCKEIARVLEPYFVPENLFVISSDFSHYPSYDDAVDNDLRTADAICSNHPQQLLKVLEENKKKKIDNLDTSLCGWTSVLTLLYLTEDKDVVFYKTDYQNSGDAKYYGDKKRVVGYWALSVFEKESTSFFSKEEQKELLAVAYDTIAYYLKTGRTVKPKPALTEGLLQKPGGVFVSIYIDDALRGCMGNFTRTETVIDLVQRLSVASACDYRFKDILPDELDKMKIEISILTPLKKIDSIDEIELGKHGIYIKKGAFSGTFLPQVASKTGWNLHEFLGHCARDKAGLGWEGWKDAEIYIYEAFIFRG